MALQEIHFSTNDEIQSSGIESRGQPWLTHRMPTVFVHGVPETAALWDDVRKKLGRRDTVAVSLPGFGCARPAGFTATKEAYVDWLIGEIEKVGPPVDLVGHDWGGGFSLRVACLRPDLLRSWVSDAASVGDVEFRWHEFAKIWQTPEAGEQFFRDQLALSIEERARTFEDFGVPAERARTLAAGIDSTMAACILALYRSAVEVGREWAPGIREIRTPGLVIIPSDDPFLGKDGSERTARDCGAKIAKLAGVGHWWPLQAPELGAETLSRFWSSLGG
jgi:pimeloyl-ACP methyl ester carboxylesterase